MVKAPSCKLGFRGFDSHTDLKTFLSKKEISFEKQIFFIHVPNIIHF